MEINELNYTNSTEFNFTVAAIKPQILIYKSKLMKKKKGTNTKGEKHSTVHLYVLKKQRR